uniref:Uncharacterized protein n=1 Tax=uncultured Chlorobiota bacterium TaxID=156405 RepID=H5SGL6_9BACT|nr:hypothetical protein HGMM_F27B02C04 [uncultured Chlorobiota bacterium]
MLSGKREHDLHARGETQMLVQFRRSTEQLQFLAGEDHRTGTGFSCPPAKEVSELRTTFPNDGTAARLDNPNFLPGNSLERLAEPLLVVKVNAGNDRYQGQHNVGGVVSSSHADFDNGNVNGMLSEEGKSQGGTYLEERRADVLCLLQEPGEESSDFRVRDRARINADAFSEVL